MIVLLPIKLNKKAFCVGRKEEEATYKIKEDFMDLRGEINREREL